MHDFSTILSGDFLFSLQQHKVEVGGGFLHPIHNGHIFIWSDQDSFTPQYFDSEINLRVAKGDFPCRLLTFEWVLAGESITWNWVKTLKIERSDTLITQKPSYSNKHINTVYFRWTALPPPQDPTKIFTEKFGIKLR